MSCASPGGSTAAPSKAGPAAAGARSAGPVRGLVLVVLCAMALTGCSVGKWEKPGVSEDQLAFDRQACRSLARAEGERVERRQPVPTQGSGNIIGTRYDSAMRNYDFAQARQRHFNRCMEGRGYRRSAKPLFKGW